MHVSVVYLVVSGKELDTKIYRKISFRFVLDRTRKKREIGCLEY